MSIQSVLVLAVVGVLGVLGEAELTPTRVSATPDRTVPSTEVLRPQYVQTLYKNTDHQVVSETVQPLWPSYEVSYYSTRMTEIQNQNISTSNIELSTTLRSTVDFYTELDATSTWDVAPTTYQTMDFQHQKVMYTDALNVSHTVIEDNNVPIL